MKFNWFVHVRILARCKTVIIAVVNKAYVEQDVKGDAITMFDLFLSSFWLGEGTRSLIDNLLIVAIDRTAMPIFEIE
ncbi:nucleotide-diphospho-sugar transferase family protein, putative [Medicago truncatula]|uniref:Nucleotide-diphospho-sugar transferase family protein, putative n=1 Tax=Medicago truncatula TaxID=3880 RepID=A0A072UBR3_MEDTR|nr:nucleotide-diphospho-sugar transferase family protein, putative [Medicago truncatula]